MMEASKKHAVIGALLLSLALAPFSFAQNEEGGESATAEGTPLQGRVKNLKDRALDRAEKRAGVLEEKNGNATSSLAGRRDERIEQMQNRVRAFAGRMVKRIQAAFRRLEKLVERIESRIAKLEEVNKNIQTAEAKKHLAEAKELIQSGKIHLSEAESLIGGMATSDTPREAFQKIHDLVKTSVADLRKAHESIKNALRSLKAAVGAGGGTATTTE